MANAPYLQGTVTVTSTPTLVCSPLNSPGGVLVQNGAAVIFLGGPNVTTSGATQGVSVAINGTVTVPTVAQSAHDLYAVCATSSSVSYLIPS